MARLIGIEPAAAAMDLDHAQSKYDAKTGLLLTMATIASNPETGKAEPSKDLKLRIQLTSQESSLKLEGSK